MTHTCAKGEGQRSLGSKYRGETDLRTDIRMFRDDCVTFIAATDDNKTQMPVIAISLLGC